MHVPILLGLVDLCWPLACCTHSWFIHIYSAFVIWLFCVWLWDIPYLYYCCCLFYTFRIIYSRCVVALCAEWSCRNFNRYQNSMCIPHMEQLYNRSPFTNLILRYGLRHFSEMNWTIVGIEAGRHKGITNPISNEFSHSRILLILSLMSILIGYY